MDHRPERRMGKRAFLLLSVFLLAMMPEVSGSEEIPHVSSEMEEAAYWIKRLPEPDKVLLSPRQIKRFNRKFLHAEPTAVDPFTLKEKVSTSFFLGPIEREEASLLRMTLFDRRGRRVGKQFFEALRESAGLKNIPYFIPVRFGLIIEECSLRTFPTMEPVVETRGKLAFDLFQQTTLHLGTPIAVLWESHDGKWLYLVSTLLRGWVQKENVAMFKDKKGLIEYQKGEKIIVTERRVPFYMNPIGEPIGEWGMGTILHTVSSQGEENFYRINRPIQDESGKVSFTLVYVRKDMVHQGFLPLTGRQILTQAFKLNGAPYGWGGLEGGWDCSSFLRDIFLTMGVELPRNSGPQSRVGNVLSRFSKVKGEGREEERKKGLLDRNIPAATFVKLDGHIMLYLGKVDDHYYVIHSIAGYREGGGWKRVFKDKFISTFRVLVSDMDLGKGGKRGSLWERTVSVNTPFVDERL